MVRLTRRSLLAGLALAASPAFAFAPRVAALDWAMAETLLALGVQPVALAEARAFALVSPLSTTAPDFGLRGAPNLEALALTAPDLILSSSYYSFIEPRLAEIAPVFTRPLYTGAGHPLAKGAEALTDLGRQLGRDPAPVLDQARATLSARPGGAPVLVFEVGDSRHIRVFGADSLYGGVIEALGLTNAWEAPTAFSFGAPVALARLAEFPDARLVRHGPVPPMVDLAASRLWSALPQLRQGRLATLPEMNAFGGLPSALAFARALMKVLA